jgi:hypothetical protein
MDGKHAAVESGTEGVFPARTYVERVQIEYESTEREENTALQGKNFGLGAQLDERTQVEADEVDADEKPGEKTEAKEHELFEDDSGGEKNFRADKP